jgi:hypothetical protein|uniref:Uncharacterized protein n=1 Tax=Debaryomyces hansenii TaxID=4959 RepID=A0A219YH63_DEBHN|nr:hypothetical protein [Debaryomyces hansenii]APZ80122.1 hypothetical protein [Debaryomyces hansenii]AUG89700.1 hypothetical protein [Debaryomyces hansenii]
MRVLCYTFTGKKLPDFIPYFFNDTINENSSIFKVIEYIKVNNEKDIKDDFNTRKSEDYLEEIYIILEDKIRLHSFNRPLNQYTYCSFRDLCSVLTMSNLSNLDIDEMIDYYTESKIPYKC